MAGEYIDCSSRCPYMVVVVVYCTTIRSTNTQTCSLGTTVSDSCRRSILRLKEKFPLPSASDWLCDVYLCAVIGQLAPTVEHTTHQGLDTEAVGHSILNHGETWRCQDSVIALESNQNTIGKVIENKYQIFC